MFVTRRRLIEAQQRCQDLERELHAERAARESADCLLRDLMRHVLARPVEPSAPAPAPIVAPLVPSASAPNPTPSTTAAKPEPMPFVLEQQVSGWGEDWAREDVSEVFDEARQQAGSWQAVLGPLTDPTAGVVQS